MTLWRRNWSRPASPDPVKRPSLYQALRKEIPAIRQQGEPPAKDPASFGRYRCDLCNASFPLQELRQCVICGRWADDNCWTPGYYVCNSCHGIIQLHQK
ncbi:MAG: hypothetical protein LUQ25_07750 [Methanoregulaceae archaeon]|nr:hypothetical protein [Methanoregulaceae archaeon]